MVQEATVEQVFVFIQDYTRKVGFSPTIKEIAIGCHLSMHKTDEVLTILEAREKITRTKRTWRNIGIPMNEAD